MATVLQAAKKSGRVTDLVNKNGEIGQTKILMPKELVGFTWVLFWMNAKLHNNLFYLYFYSTIK